MKILMHARLLLTCTVFSFGVMSAQEFTDQYKQDALEAANKLIEKAKMVPQDVYQSLAASQNSNFSDEQLEKLMRETLNLFVPNTKDNQALRSSLASMQSLLAKKLSTYKVTGFSFATDPNGAFFVNTMDPEFDIVFKDGQGGVKTRRYKALINSVGFKIELAVNFDMIFILGTSANFYDLNKEIELGFGVSTNLWPLQTLINNTYKEPNPKYDAKLLADMSFFDAYFSESEFMVPNKIKYPNHLLGLFAFTYVPFKNMAGGMFIIHAKLGLAGIPETSMITGGKLLPVF